MSFVPLARLCQTSLRQIAGSSNHVSASYDFADKLLGRVDDLIAADMADTGRSYWQASTFDGARAARLFKAYADMAIGLESRSSTFSGGVHG